MQTGVFREDLCHRLNLLTLTLPPLRERGTDLAPLARHLLEGIATRHRLKGLTITAEGASRLLAQSWPGNIRELAHEIERAVIFSQSPQLDFATLGDASPQSSGSWRNPAWRMPESGFSLDATMDELIAEALRESDNNVSAAARRLGVTRDFIRYRLADTKSV